MVPTKVPLLMSTKVPTNIPKCGAYKGTLLVSTKVPTSIPILVPAKVSIKVRTYIVGNALMSNQWI